jgi:hypothetical protein
MSKVKRRVRSGTRMGRINHEIARRRLISAWVKIGFFVLGMIALYVYAQS